MFFLGRLAWVEAQVEGMSETMTRHLDECNEERRESARRHETLLESMHENAKFCGDKADGVQKYLANLILRTLCGALVLILALVAALLKFHPTL